MRILRCSHCNWKFISWSDYFGHLSFHPNVEAKALEEEVDTEQELARLDSLIKEEWKKLCKVLRLKDE